MKTKSNYKFKITPDKVRLLFNDDYIAEFGAVVRLDDIKFEWTSGINCGFIQATWPDPNESHLTHSKEFSYLDLFGKNDPLSYLATEQQKKDIWEAIAETINDYFKDYEYSDLPF